MPIAGLYEVLTAFPVAARFYEGVPSAQPFHVEIVSSTRTNMVAASGLPIAIQRSVEEIEQTDVVIVPTMAVEESWETGQYPELVAWMRRMHEHGAMLCSACTGLLVLAETGLLDGRRATTHWAVEPTFRRNFPEVELCLNEVLISAGDREEFVTSGGGASWQDLVLYLIGRFVSPVASQAIAKFELLEQHAEGQVPYLSFRPRMQHGDSLVLGLQEWLVDNLAVQHPVAEVILKSGLSSRALERRFRRATGYSPIGYVQHLRIEEAKRRLERTATPIEQISWDVGYQEAAAFRRLFKRITSVTPGDYRRKFTIPDFA